VWVREDAEEKTSEEEEGVKKRPPRVSDKLNVPL
jgi:hypothetical protein